MSMKGHSMNQKLVDNINAFINFVGWYLKSEYDQVYYERFLESDIFDFVGSYYMGGSTVPDTARYVVELILMKERDRREQI